MQNNDDVLAGLREALKVSPNNLPLRKSIAQTLAGLGRYEEAEQEYRQAIGLAPRDLDLKTALADIFFQQHENSKAMVVIEDLVKDPDAPAAAHLLHARLLVGAGQERPATSAYRKAIEKDESVADEMLAAKLGVTAGEYDDGFDDPFEGRVPAPRDEMQDDAITEIERPKVNFDDVGGMDKVKEEINLKIIAPMTHPEIYEAYGKKVGGGILMYGPPGCGKTHLARATAGQVSASFISVGIHNVLDMWLGQSEMKLHELFENARANKPCVLFFDEVDALGASRTDMRGSSSTHLINQFLSELDGIDHDNEGVLILAATNAPWHLDPAFRRPGRFDRIVLVPPPDAPARAAILGIQLRDKPTDKIDYSILAKKTEGFSGADLKGIVDITIEAKLKDAMARGIPTPINTKDLLATAKQVKASTKEWFATARNYALYSNQGGIYDEIIEYMGLR